jgi:hypothetical protein
MLMDGLVILQTIKQITRGDVRTLVKAVDLANWHRSGRS